MRKAPPKKRVTRSVTSSPGVDPTRLSIAALERIRTVLVRAGHEGRFGSPLDSAELEAQAALLGSPLPPSYVAVMRVASSIGEPEVFLVARTMKPEVERIAQFGAEAAKRYAPFAKSGTRILCFDKGVHDTLDEVPVVAWADGTASPVAAHFADWLDAVADRREEAFDNAVALPPRLAQLLYDLGFRFDYALVGRLETGDVEAITRLIGEKRARSIRADADRLFDSSGKASLTLNVDEFTLAVSLRTGIYVFEAEDVFRWLRTFRDENFFSDSPTSSPAHGNAVRDLRRAPREPLLIQRGVLTLPAMPAPNLVFRAASGTSGDDFYLLARTASTSERGPSTIFHMVGRKVATSHKVDAALGNLHVTPDGTIWGLSNTHALRINNGRAQTFALPRQGHGRPWWYGIGGFEERIVVWGAGALLFFDGMAFVPFAPDAMLDETESVVSFVPRGSEIRMLVCGDRMGAVADFDSVAWQPIAEHQVIVGSLSDLDVRRGIAYVVGRDTGVWKIDADRSPHPVALLTHHQAFLTEAGTPRPIHGVRAWSGGLLLASDGGVIAVGGAEPLFHAAATGRDPVRLIRLEDPTREEESEDSAIVALSGPNAWLWEEDGFSVLDMRDG